MICPLLDIIVALMLIAGNATLADAALCRDTKGKLIKTLAAATLHTVPCEDAKGMFTKCGTLIAIPIKG